MMTPGMRLRSTAAIMAMSFGGMAVDPFNKPRYMPQVKPLSCLKCGAPHFHKGGYCSVECHDTHVPIVKAVHNPPNKKKSRSKRKK